MGIVEALRADSGIVCAVGAGGKKTTLYALAERTAGESSPVVTATVRIPIFDPHVERVAVTGDPVSTVERVAAGDAGATGDGDSASDRFPLGVVPERESGNRYRGYDPTVVDELAATPAADPVLVKADGARTRQLKAPSDREPQLPRRADTVVPIASARVVGEPLTADRVHRPERVAEITGRGIGEPIRAADVARVLASDRGGLKSVPDGAAVVALVNMIDDEGLRAVGDEIAAEVLDRTDRVSRVVLARMTASEPLIAVVE